VPNDPLKQPTLQQMTLEKIMARIEKIGDLPIFSASVNRIRMMSASEETEVTELANEIGKDANLTTKLLRVANSPYYSRGDVKVGVVSRAVMMMGFDTVRNVTLAMKVIDSFQFKHPQINMSSLLVKSYLAAGFTREVAFKCDAKDPEATYTCGLLHNVGEIVVAVALPDEYLKMLDLVAQNKLSWSKAQMQVLGMTIKQVAQEVLAKWSFPNNVVKTVTDFNKADKGKVRNQQDLNCALASYGARVMDCLYTPHTSGELDYQKLLLDLQEVSGLRGDVLTQCLNNSFKMSCDLAEQYGLDKKLLRPKVIGTEDDARNKTARTLAYLAGSDAAAPERTTAPPAQADAQTTEGAQQAPGKVTRGDAAALINILHDITVLITQHADINAVFSRILEGIQHGVGFDHAMLCLLTPDRSRYKARFAVGPNAEPLKSHFNNDVNPTKDLFSRTALSGGEVLVKNVHDESWRGVIKHAFVEGTGVNTFVVAALKLGDKSIGFFYADTSLSQAEITPELFRGFVQLVSQARIALSVRR
jgi:HD-like signal output (HDOD) protein